MIALFVVFLVCCSFCFVLGAAWATTFGRIRAAREEQLDITPAIRRNR